MYLAKVNLTKGIFDVYDQKINIDTVISEIYNKLTDSVVYNTSANYNYRDSMGNRKKCYKNLNMELLSWKNTRTLL